MGGRFRISGWAVVASEWAIEHALQFVILVRIGQYRNVVVHIVFVNAPFYFLESSVEQGVKVLASVDQFLVGVDSAIRRTPLHCLCFGGGGNDDKFNVRVDRKSAKHLLQLTRIIKEVAHCRH